MKLKAFAKITDQFSDSPKMPILFIGHGHPINAILDNDFTQKLSTLGKQLEKPNAIAVISAHWETNGTYVSTNPNPHTIYDFGNFDDRLLEIKYEPKGAPHIAQNLIDEVEYTTMQEDHQMGLDHGAWTVMKFLFPEADIPTFQISIDMKKEPNYHFELGQALSSLRKKGVLVLASGNIVHNLYQIDWHNIQAKPFDWNIEFDELVKDHLHRADFLPLINYHQFGKAAKLSIPTNDHYLPMLYTLGLAQKGEEITHLYEGYQYGAISMRCFQIG